MTPDALHPSSAQGSVRGERERPRQHLQERKEYVAGGPTEHFIVPLLAREIEARLGSPTAMPKFVEGDAALDVGCGRQPLRKRIEALGYRYVGLDTQQNDDVPVDVVAPIDGALPDALLGRGPFKLIVCTEVLEHVADWGAAFSNFSRLLAPGGRVLITCPHVYMLHEEPYDFWRATPHAIRHYADRHGLSCVEVSRLGSGWEALGTVLSTMGATKRPGAIGSGLAVLAFKALRRATVRMLMRGWPQRLIQMNAEIYQSNLAILEKP